METSKSKGLVGMATAIVAILHNVELQMNKQQANQTLHVELLHDWKPNIPLDEPVSIQRDDKLTVGSST